MAPIIKILIIIAMQQEANPIIAALNLNQKTSFDAYLPMKVYSRAGFPVVLIVNGIDTINNVDCVGTQAASVATLMAIKTFNPEVIVNAGTAGGFKEHGAQIGDVYVATKAFYHDRRIKLPGFEEYGIGGYPCDTLPEITTALHLKKGVVSTGNSLDLLPQDILLMKQYNASVKDMEAAAIAWVAMLYKKPIVVLKGVTDFVDAPEKNHTDFLKNLDLASSNLSIQCEKLVEMLLKAK